MGRIQELSTIKNGACTEECHHFIGITPIDAEVVPIACPVCQFLMKDLHDSLAYRKFTCCNNCALRWAIVMGEEWQNGVRPTLEELKQYILARKRQPSYQV